MQVTQAIIEKAKAIRLLILDVDGILTSGLIYYGEAEEKIQGFHIHDGLGIKLLQQAGIPVAIISAKNLPSVAKRAHDLNIEYIYLGCENKLLQFEPLLKKLN